MKNKNLKLNKNGISLIVLVITIIVVILLATAIILIVSKNNPMDSAKKAKFMSNFTNVEEGVTIYATSKLSEENIEYILPIKNKLTLSDKTEIKDTVPTLQAKIEELSAKSIDNVDLYYIDETLIGAENLYSQKPKGYLIDTETKQIYDYSGEYFEDLRWHTLDAGVGEITKEIEVDEIWDGWIKLTLYYPSNSTEKMWRLSSVGETRTDSNLEWQDYTGSITIPLNKIQDVWIKYKINDETVVIPPAGTALVDIEPDSTQKDISSVKVNIVYDKDATKKEYKVGDGGWQTYTGEFTIIKNCLIEARVVKPDNVYNSNGILIQQRNAENSDAYYVGNIKEDKIVDYTLASPRIARLSSTVEGEVAKISVTYPENAVNKVYTTNYGIEQTYTQDIGVSTYGTYILAYYYDASGKKSPAAGISVDEIETGPKYMDLIAPTINNLGKINSNEITSLSVTHPVVATNKVYTINNGLEIPYTGNISITAYRTYLKAYYYAADGRKSDYNYIYISEGGTDGPPPPTDITPIEPTINVTPSTVTTTTQVSISAPSNADRIYISLANGQYNLYTSPITVTSNMDVRAKYITYEGKPSYTAYKRINNIRPVDGTGKILPYVGISVTPSTNGIINQATVTINSADATTVEYSYNGIVYEAYTNSFEVTSNCRIYARAKNANGTSRDQIDISNIGKFPPKPKTNLAVNISATPEPSATSILKDKVKIAIEYDADAKEKYYTIGENGILTTYTGEFEVTSNCAIYAYALSDTAKGSDTKIIDNIVNGISDPLIVSNPQNNIQSNKNNIKITYDKNATIKQFKIGNGQLRDYVSEFEVTQNCTIYAYSKNAKGQIGTSSYIVTNIPAPPKVITIDYGKYYLLKLNFPEEASTREYKWKAEGTWKNYSNEGILLIRPQYKNEFLNAGGNLVVKIKDENGKDITFTGDYYLLDVGPSEINENIFMRWDRTAPTIPQIILNTIEPVREVMVSILYEEYLIKKQYKIVDKEGNIVTDWTDYTTPIKIISNNTTIYAKGQDNAEVWSGNATKKITNIDEEQPVIKLIVDITTAQQNIPVRVNVTDDVAVGKVKWAKGILANSYFISGGTEISNESIVKITENGYYTFYAEDKAGNTQIYTLNIENIDLIPPKILISISPETTTVLSTIATIDYADSITKQYKIGENNAIWSTYTAPVNISSYTVMSNNWKNSDGTVTISAKGIDSVGNVTIISKKIVNLDLDIPAAPVITSNSGYPILKNYGIELDSLTSITYDTRTDIDNYYSVDNGTTWKIYTGSFQYLTGTIMAKSVKKNTGLEKVTSKTMVMPSNALNINAYDGNDSTYVIADDKYMKVDSTLGGNSIRLKWFDGWYGLTTIDFINESGVVLSRISPPNDGSVDQVYVIPTGTSWIRLYGNSGAGGLYEIQLSNEATFSATNGYMLITADPTKAIKKPYQMVKINYFPTSVQRQYKIGATGTWINYIDKEILVNQGETIYAKGIDQYGNPTRTISTYTANVTNAIGPYAFDGNNTTYVAADDKYMRVDSSLGGKNLRLKWFDGWYGLTTIDFINESGVVLGTISTPNDGSVDQVYVIPNGTSWIRLYGNSGAGGLYEIQLSNEPTFSTTNGYMLLHSDPTKAVKKPYQMVKINYFPTSLQKLYKIGSTGTWINYIDKDILVNQGETIYAKGIDQYGNETRIISNYTANVTDAIGPNAYDGNYSTYDIITTIDKYMRVDGSLDGKSVRIKWSDNSPASNIIYFLNSSKAIISTISVNETTIDQNYIIPVGTRWIKSYRTANNGSLFEIAPIG